ncbi:MAG: MBL fold metallo-hydrolase [Lysobacterales bacterium]
MKLRLLFLIVVFIGTSVDGRSDTRAHTCPATTIPTLQVLGSGGPIADDGRASSGYLIWIDGRSKILIDAGGGVFLRFGEAGARFDDLDFIAISHFHADHSTDLVALLKSGYFSDRSRKLPISGPAAGGVYPGIHAYLERLLSLDHGAYAYLNGYLDGSAGLVKLQPVEVDPKLEHPSDIYTDPGADIEIHAIGVPHGPVPALAYRIRIGQRSIVFAGDQNGGSDSFIDFARGADVLVMHLAVPENISGIGRNLHAPPSVIGRIAAETGAGKLVLSHFMARSLFNREENLKIIRSRYSGPVVSADDLICINL